MRGTRLLYLLAAFVAIMTCLPSMVHAQNFTVKGTVKDSQGNPLQGVSVKIKGTSTGISTAANGSFSLPITGTNNSLEFTYVGFKTKTVAVKGQDNITVILQEYPSQLADVVVIGYGSQKKSEVSGAVSSIKNKDFKDQPLTNLAASIEGKLSGINVTTPSGTPGAGLQVSIRGAQNPLYVVDGVPMVSESNSSLGTSYNLSGESVGSGQNISSISDINPDDIESIEVLKDAAKAIYGARAANGVVLVTTKRGRTGKTNFSLNYYTGLQDVVKKIPFLNSQQFYNLTNQAIANDINLYHNEATAFGFDSSRFGPLSVLQSVGIVDANGQAVSNPVAPYYDLSSGVNTNWENAIFRTAPINNFELSARGGSDKTKFYIGGGYFDQTGIIINNYYKRYNARVNIDNQATDNLSFGTTMSLSRSDNKRSFNDNTYTGIVTNALGASPLMPVYNTDGSYSDFTQYQASWLSDNPVKSAKEVNAHTYTNRLIGSAFGEYKIFSSLKFRTTWSLDLNDVTDNQYFSALTVDAQTVGGKLLTGHLNSLTWLNENNLTFQQKYGDHNITVLAGFSQQSSHTTRTAFQATGFPQTGNTQDLSDAAFVSPIIMTNPVVNFALKSYYARLLYSYQEKYLFTGILRADGSSRFPSGSRYGYFPSASLGWNIAKEKFLADNKKINELKLRVSYGISGFQDDIPDYQGDAYYRATRYNGVAGLGMANLPSKDLTWQHNSSFNTGIDFDLFNHFLNGSIEYFVSERTKLLGQTPLAGTTGFASLVTNAGQIEDRGWEFQLGTNNIQTQNFTWTSSFNISFLKNKIVSLAVDSQYISSYNDQSPTHILKIGQPVGTFIGVRFAGVNVQNGDAEYYAADGTKERADQVNFTRDAAIIGNARPKFFGGFTNNFKYKKFDLMIATQFSYGAKVYNLIRTTYESLGWSGSSDPGSAYLPQVYSNNDTRALNAWKKPGDVTNIPRASYLLQNYFPNSDQFLENGSFFKIRTVNLGYTFKKTKYFNSIRIYAQAQNLLTISKYIGFDPEVSSTGGGNDATAGVDYAAYPPARTFSFGVNFNL